MQQTNRVTFGLVFLFGCVLVLSAQKKGDMTPDGPEIVKRMASRYATAKSYQDEGVVLTLSKTKAARPVNSFKTYFVRPKKFRFEWKDVEDQYKGELYVVWSDGEDVFSYFPFKGLEKEDNLGMGIAGATGISSGAAHTISVLLLPNASGFRVTEMDRIALNREEAFEGITCYVVKGFHPFGYAIELWIGKEDLLIRRILEHNTDGTFDEEIRRNIRVDDDIAHDIFRFTPPTKPEKLIGCLSVAIIPAGLAVYLGISRKRLINT